MLGDNLGWLMMMVRMADDGDEDVNDDDYGEDDDNIKDDDEDDGDVLGGDNLGGLMASILRSEFSRGQPLY